MLRDTWWIARVLQHKTDENSREYIRILEDSEFDPLADILIYNEVTVFQISEKTTIVNFVYDLAISIAANDNRKRIW